VKLFSLVHFSIAGFAMYVADFAIYVAGFAIQISKPATENVPKKKFFFRQFVKLC
jgi:hypothetical protein